MALSPNYNWSEPDNSSLVKDGAQAMRTLGDAIDTSVWNVGFGQAGKNKVINGDFSVWQRGTSFTGQGVYTADRWITGGDGAPTVAISQQSFTAGAAPVAGYESNFFYRFGVTSAGGSTYRQLQQRIENVRTFAGQTVTFSFWAKLNSGTVTTPYFRLNQVFGSGGSATVYGDTTAFTLTSSWQRFTGTTTVASISGKTVGSNSYVELDVVIPFTTTMQVDFWGFQVEAGSKATPFQTASGGSIQGELAMCQRYYYRFNIEATPNRFGIGFNNTTTFAYINNPFPVPMRTRPTALEQTGTATDYSVVTSGTTVTVCSAVPTFDTATQYAGVVGFTVASGLTAGQGCIGRPVNTNAFLGWSAEL
jgi:hypothetical protein